MGTWRAVLLVRHGQDRADRGIAALMGRAEGPVAQLAHRAHGRLRARPAEGARAEQRDAGERWPSARGLACPTAAAVTVGARWAS